MFVQKHAVNLQVHRCEQQIIPVVATISILLLISPTCFGRHLNNHYLPRGNQVTSSAAHNKHSIVQTHFDNNHVAEASALGSSGNNALVTTIAGGNSNHSEVASQRRNGEYASFEFSLPSPKLIRYVNDVNRGDGNYKYEIEIDNGIYQQESGHFYNTGTKHEQKFVQGAFSYLGPDGEPYTVTYTADVDGFHPQGSHLPTPPPVPDEILKSLKKVSAAASAKDAPSKQNDANKIVEEFDLSLLVPPTAPNILKYQGLGSKNLFAKNSGYF